ncbi:MAG: hypothetical protein N3E45_00485 [Oscillatoriaceae bacterium SKW80]|nr:hypothetical protein [Oscillatoriaceae bacterium SKYG93]MCX8119305.1 hypothetical protein [Oscillatoriaceae bacterium SKW80]MDW8454772.1 hypothetical protein [Oscillatoriaceae cyanobacterium SKYGB_i_bin93]
MISASFTLSCFLCGFSQQALLFSQPLSELIIDSEKLAYIQFSSARTFYPTNIVCAGGSSEDSFFIARESAKNIQKPSFSFFSKMSAKPGVIPDNKPILINPHLHIQDVLDNQCRKEPIGVGIPGFQPGTPKSIVRNMFGAPSKILSGYWPNTIALVYDLVPGEISLGFLFDRDSGRLRQTEVSFADSVESRVVLLTLNSLLGCRINEDIKQGLQQVRRRESNSYYFTLESIKGAIERDARDRVYIGVWEADLH